MMGDVIFAVNEHVQSYFKKLPNVLLYFSIAWPTYD